MLRIKDPDRLPGGLRLEVCPERFFFDRATPLRWVVSSLRSVSAEYPSQQTPAYTSDAGGRPSPQLSDMGGGVSSSLLRHRSVDGIQTSYRQPSQISGTSNGYESHLQYSQHTPLHLQSQLGQQGFLGSFDGLSNMEHERIPRSTSYVFLTVSLLLKDQDTKYLRFNVETLRYSHIDFCPHCVFVILIELTIAATSHILPIFGTLETTFVPLLHATCPQMLALGGNHPFDPKTAVSNAARHEVCASLRSPRQYMQDCLTATFEN